MQSIDEQLKAKINAIISVLPSILKESGQKVPLYIQSLINSNMNPGDKTRDPLKATINTSDQLNSFRNLARSFTQGQPGSLTEVKIDASGAVVNVGSSLIYAAIHEYGGRIQAKKTLGSVKRKKDVFAMEQYFWAMYYKSKKENEYFKNLALKIAKDGFITIRARPYFNPAIKDFENKDLLGILQNIINQLIKLF